MQTRDAMHVEAHARDVCAPTTAPGREAVAASALVFQPLLADVFALSIPTVCLDVTSLVAYSYGYDDGKNGPTRCALIGAGFGDRQR
jgi:hypothetical protein